jgi:YVTN family beta-propeller protein
MKTSLALGVGSMALILSLAPSAFAGSVKAIPVGSAPKFVAVNQTTNRVYVSNILSSNVSVIDGATDTVVATIPVGSFPEVVDVNSITNMVYVASGGRVSVIDGNSNTVVATINSGSLTSAYGLAVNSITNKIFVSNISGDTVAVVDGVTNTVTTTILVGSEPCGVRVDSTANLVYVVSLQSKTVAVIDGVTDMVKETFNLPGSAEPLLITLEPIANRLFVTDSAANVIYVLDASSGTLLDTLTNSTVPFGVPVYVAMFQPGKTILISDEFSGCVIEVNETTYTPSGRLKGGSGAYGIALNRQTGKIYVAESGDGTVNVYKQ